MSGSNDGRTAGTQKSYDAGLFDPSVHDNQIVALYDTDANARMARDKLIAAGVEASAVQVMDRQADRMAGGVDYEAGDQGIWGAIKSLFMPDDDAHAYNHAVGQGHAMIVVTPTANTDRHHIIEVLESTDPIDFDAKLEEWRQTGYDYTGSTTSTDNRNTASRIPVDYAVNQSTDTNRVPPAGTDARTGAPPSGRDARGDTVGNTFEAGVERAEAAVVGAAGAVGNALGLTDGDRMNTQMPARGDMDRQAAATGSDDDTIRIVEERLRIGKREVAKGAVRVRSYVVERPVEEQVRLHEESVTVDRRPVDRAATGADEVTFRDQVIKVEARSEEPVVSKEARVVEEIGLRKQATERVETVRDTVRRTEVDIQDDKSTGMAAPSSTVGAATSGTNAPRK